MINLPGRRWMKDIIQDTLNMPSREEALPSSVKKFICPQKFICPPSALKKRRQEKKYGYSNKLMTLNLGLRYKHVLSDIDEQSLSHM